MTKYGHSKPSALAKELPPVAFDEDVSVASVLISRGYPYGMLMRRFLPTSGLPGIGIAVIAMISADPNVPPAWPDAAVLVDADRRSQLDHYLRVSGYYPHGDSKKRGQKQFSHLVLLHLHKHGDGRSSLATGISMRKNHSIIEIAGAPILPAVK
jgi:hypothetical protein